MYRTDELEEDEEELEGKFHLYGGDEVIIVPFVYPCGAFSVLSLGSFSYVCYSYKPSRPSLPLSIRALQIQEHFKKKRGRKIKLFQPQQEKARHEERMKRGKVIFRAKLVVGYLELIPME